MQKYLLLLIVTGFYFTASGQSDSTQNLDEIIVRGFETHKANLKTPAAVSSISFEELQRFNGTNPLLILNHQAGVRVEERSPGSYRIALRGSSIRSQFGVRNVKIYYNGIPMSDANGTTYFNQVDFNSFGNIEILKGPSSSIFGAGYGGVLSLNTIVPESGNKLSANILGGSYNSLSNHTRYEYGGDKLSLMAASTIGHSDGYREHSNLLNNKLTLAVNYKINYRHSLNYSNYYGDIDYQTPGGLTQAQLENNRRAARPATPVSPGAVEQRAGIIQAFNLQGLTHHWYIHPTASLSTTVFAVFNHLQNPFLTNYEDRRENTFGYRILGQKDIGRLSLQLGSEAISTDSDFDVTDNIGGKKGNPQYFTNLKSSQLSHFIQLQYGLPFDFDFTAGLSYNQQKYLNTTRVSGQSARVKETPGVPLIPRLAILKSFKNRYSLFYSWSSGFSSPTAQEITANFENASQIHLVAEEGISHEMGFKIDWNPAFRTELSAYHQDVQDALIRSVNAAGGEFFENTGNIIQNGLELTNQYAFKNPDTAIASTLVSFTTTFNDFKFDDYINDGTDLKGKELPGTSKVNLYLSAMVSHRSGVYLNTDVNYLSKAPLTSNNSVYAKEMILSAARLGWQKNIREKTDIKVYGGVDNLLNQEYSFGYDYNAFGGRYFNPAPKRNFNAGINVSVKI